VRVTWHPGHPEKRKVRNGSDWNARDRAIFLADGLAEVMHRTPGPAPSRSPTEWSHKPPWRVFWRGTELLGKLNDRVKDAVRVELLSSYLASTGIGPGTDGDWIVPELLLRTVGRKEGDLSDKVFRAKTIASILGTKYTQLRRNGLDVDADPLCRLSGEHLETDTHVLWECSHTAVASKRRALCKRVKTAWRQAGMSQRELAVANLPWTLDPGDVVVCADAAGIVPLLGDTAAVQAHLLANALIRHALDTSGMLVERSGLFGKGWVTLLCSMGMDGPKALDTMVSVSEVLQGTDGTVSIWRAFTALLDTPESAITDLAPVQGGQEGYFAWAEEVRSELSGLGECEDEPYRQLSLMGARGMTRGDAYNFQLLAMAWQQQMADGWDAAERMDAHG
jgi:hypothetical protein